MAEKSTEIPFGPFDKLNIEPSALDIQSMVETAEDDEMHCPQPMLVIIGVWATPDRRWVQSDMSAYGFDRGSTDFIRLKGKEAS